MRKMSHRIEKRKEDKEKIRKQAKHEEREGKEKEKE